MAWEYPILNLPGQTAGADFSTGNGYLSTGQYLITKMSGDNAHVPCSSAHDQPSGIAQTNPVNGDALSVMALGVSKVMVGSGGLVAGQAYGPDAQGKAVAKGPTATGANFGDFVMGFCLEGAAAGALATVTVVPPYQV